MAFNKENFFTEGNSEESFFTRTNPLANPANAEILKIQDCGDCDIFLDVDISETMGGTEFTFGSPTDDYVTEHLKIQITDGRGNFVTNVQTGAVVDVILDTTELLGSDWTIYLGIKLSGNVLADCGCSKIFTFKYDKTELNIDTENSGAGVLALFETINGASVNTINIGTFPIGADPAFTFYIGNQGGSVLNVSAVNNITADVLTAVLPTYGNTVQPNNFIPVSGTVDGSLLAGAQSGTLDVVSDEGTITLTISYTLV
jgi:hypothetical protein